MNIGMNLVSSMNSVKPHMAGMMNAMNNAKMRSADHETHMEKPHMEKTHLAANNCCKLA